MIDKLIIESFTIIFKHYEVQDPETGFIGTVCYIFYEEELWAEGYTNLAPGDTYHRGMGRNLSLSRALSNLSEIVEGDFSMFWEKYEEKFNDTYLWEDNPDLRRFT